MNPLPYASLFIVCFIWWLGHKTKADKDNREKAEARLQAKITNTLLSVIAKKLGVSDDELLTITQEKNEAKNGK